MKNDIKQQIKKIDNKIEIERKRTIELNKIQEDLDKLNKKIFNCIELFKLSVKGGNSEKCCDNLNKSSLVFYKNFSNSIDEEVKKIKEKIKKLNEEKIKIEKKSGDSNANSTC